jgi:hypothetical protein
MLMDDKKKIMIISGAICLLVATSFGIYFLVTERSRTAVPAATAPAVEKKAAPVGTPTTNETIKKAVKESKPEVCEELTGSGRDECYYIAILNVRDTALCLKKIENQDMKDKCLNEINFAEAIEDGDAKACLTLTDSRSKEECLRTKFRGTDKLETCKTYSDQTAIDLCESNVYSNMAYEADRVDDCQTVKDEVLRFDCQTMVKNKPKDEDGDGLSDDYEIMIMTDPFKADTDGDGCKDGDEMKSKHSPTVKDAGADCLKKPFIPE